MRRVSRVSFEAVEFVSEWMVHSSQLVSRERSKTQGTVKSDSFLYRCENGFEVHQRRYPYSTPFLDGLNYVSRTLQTNGRAISTFDSWRQPLYA